VSLFLRKRCQEKLDNVGLENYHVQVDEPTKCLTIVGECGQLLTTIEGIRLSRMAPNDKEIMLALDLLDDFLTKHTHNFKLFREAKAAADKAKIPQPADLKHIVDATVEKQRYQDYWELKFTPVGALFDVTVKSNGKVTVSQFSTKISNSDSAKLTNGMSADELRDMVGWVVACEEFTDTTNEKNRVLDILKSCEV
jgi:hypothetical protein